ncbi:unnamed protein product [Urochloa humidicola]
MAVDESTRYKPEFVRIKIACRDIYAVPDSAEGSLGMYLYDFFYELEELINFNKLVHKQPVKVPNSEDQPSPKKMRTGTSDTTSKGAGSGSIEGKMNPGKDEGGKQSYDRSYKSAPSLLSKSKPANESVSPDELNVHEAEDGEVIPAATYEPSKDISDNEDSGTSGDFSDQVRQTFGDKSSGTSTVWQFACTTFTQENIEEQILEKCSGPSSVQISEIEVDEDEDKGEPNKTSLEACELNLRELNNPREQIKAQYAGRRWSARTQHKMMEGKAQEENGAIKKPEGNKKRNHEGLHKEAFQGKILEGVQVLLACAHKVMARNSATPARLRLTQNVNQEQDKEG